MGYADGYYYGQGRIICDTSTFSVGDTIRVRSMTDSSKVWNQQVATVGTALVFTVPCYDYYKICTVQDIGGVLTEIGGVYKTVDYGQTLFINVLDKTTLGGIQGILNAHQETSLLNIGDEVDITVNGSPWTMQIAGINVYNSHDIMFVSKHMWTVTSNYAIYTSPNNTIRPIAQQFYADIDNKDKQYIKQVTRQSYYNGANNTYDDYCFVLGNKETVHNAGYGEVSSQIQLPLFVTQANRIKTYQGTVKGWFDADWGTNQQVIDGNGNMTYGTDNNGVVPAFMLIADS